MRAFLRTTPDALALLALTSLLLCSCATGPESHDQIPPGPSAVIADTAGSLADSGDLFILEEIDGKPVTWTAREASKGASFGHGFHFVPVSVSRYVAAGHHRFKIAAVRVYAAPISEILHSFSNQPVEGFVEVDIRADANYLVDGEVNRFRKEVWLQEIIDGNGRILGDKVVKLLEDPQWLPLKPTASYTCCNLHYDDDSIAEANWTGLPFVPAGSRIVLRGREKNKALVWLEGQKMEIELEDGDKLASIDSVLARIVVAGDPNLKIATYSEPIQKAIRLGQVLAGMTREQVILSLGYPRLDANPSLDATTWKYGLSEKSLFTLVWDADGKLLRVDGSPNARSAVEYMP